MYASGLAEVEPQSNYSRRLCLLSLSFAGIALVEQGATAHLTNISNFFLSDNIVQLLSERFYLHGSGFGFYFISIILWSISTNTRVTSAL